MVMPCSLRAQPVGEPGQVHLGVGDLVGHQRLGVVEEPADERGLAVVDGPGGGEAQELGLGPRRRGGAAARRGDGGH
jgi:hypothetical protein